MQSHITLKITLLLYQILLKKIIFLLSASKEASTTLSPPYCWRQ